MSLALEAGPYKCRKFVLPRELAYSGLFPATGLQLKKLHVLAGTGFSLINFTIWVRNIILPLL
jgi:hypothetical protein